MHLLCPNPRAALTKSNLVQAGILQRLGVRVDFVFPQKKKKEEGRKNPHLAASRMNDPTCLNFADCLVGVWRVYGNCLEGVWRVSGGCLVGVCWVSGACLVGVWRVS